MDTDVHDDREINEFMEPFQDGMPDWSKMLQKLWHCS